MNCALSIVIACFNVTNVLNVIKTCSIERFPKKGSVHHGISLFISKRYFMCGSERARICISANIKYLKNAGLVPS